MKKKILITVLLLLSLAASYTTTIAADDLPYAYIIKVMDEDFYECHSLVNAFLYAGVPVYWSQGTFTAGGKSYRAGDFIIPISAPSIGWKILPPTKAMSLVESIAAEHMDVSLTPVDSEFKAQVYVLKPVKIAIYGDQIALCYAFNNLFKSFGVKCDTVTGMDVQAGVLDNYDIFAIPGDSWPQTYSLGEAGCNKVKEFIMDGGGLIASCAGGWTTAGQAPGETWPQKSYLEVGRWYMWNVNTSWPFDTWGDKYYTPAGIGIIKVKNENPDHPVMFGMPETFEISHWQGPMFKPNPVDHIQYPDINYTAFTVEWEDQIHSNPIPFASFYDWTSDFTFYEYYGDIEAQRAMSDTELEDTWLGRAIDEGIISVIGGYMGTGKVVVAGSHPELGVRLSLGDKIDLPARMFSNAILWESSETDYNPVSFPVQYGLEQSMTAKNNVLDLFNELKTISPTLPSQQGGDSTFGMSNEEKYLWFLEHLPDTFDALQAALEEAEDVIPKLEKAVSDIQGVEEHLTTLKGMGYIVEEELAVVRGLEEEVLMALRAFNEDINFIYPEEWTPNDGTPPRWYAGGALKMGLLQNMELIGTRLGLVVDGIKGEGEYPGYVWGVDSLLGGYGLHNFISRGIGYTGGNAMLAEEALQRVALMSAETESLIENLEALPSTTSLAQSISEVKSEIEAIPTEELAQSISEVKSEIEAITTNDPTMMAAIVGIIAGIIGAFVGAMLSKRM